jgi:hypothetical protein
MTDEQPLLPSSMVPDRGDYESTEVDRIFASLNIQLSVKPSPRVDHSVLVERIFGSFNNPWISNICDFDSDDK